MSHLEPGHFTRDHARLVRAVADQAALALENARLFEEARQRARETEALLRADAELYRSLSLDDVFQALCDVAVEVLGVGKTMVTTIDDDEGRYTIRASRNIAEKSLNAMMAIRKKTPRAALATMREPLVNADARAEIPEMRSVFEAEEIISTIDIPIRIDGKVRGDFSIAHTHSHAPTPDELRLYQALADRASVAIQNAELYERAQQVASLEERQRLARELHDSVSQALYGIALGARTARTQLDRDATQAVEPMEYVLSLAEAGLAEMRALIFELRPESLQTEGLVAAIEKHVASTRARYRLDVQANLGPEPQAKIEVKEALYRVAQEALHNIVKHAHAEHVVVSLDASNGTIALQVRDDGRGFDPNASYPGHVGLHSMRERIDKLQGTIEIKSKPGKGTAVNVRVPLATPVSV
jgi:signal transduction histidine kinase